MLWISKAVCTGTVILASHGKTPNCPLMEEQRIPTWEHHVERAGGGRTGRASVRTYTKRCSKCIVRWKKTPRGGTYLVWSHFLQKIPKGRYRMNEHFYWIFSRCCALCRYGSMSSKLLILTQLKENCLKANQSQMNISSWFFMHYDSCAH